MKQHSFLLFFILMLTACCTGKTGKKSAEVNQSNPCLDIIERIVTTSPKFQELTAGLSDRVIANGGRGFGYHLEGSPVAGLAINQSDMYDYRVTEEYEDRSNAVARFSFDPRKEKLYEYDVMENAHNEVEFDRSLLSSLRTSCDALPYAGKAYYTAGGKLYLFDMASNEKKELPISDKPILNFVLSPCGQYIAFEKELSRIDCRAKTKLVFYNLASNRAFQELGGGKDGLSGFVSRWEPGGVVYSLSNADREVYNYYITSEKTGKTERISEEAYYRLDGEEEPPVLNPFDEAWAVKGDGVNLTLVNTGTNKESSITSPEGRLLRESAVQWLDYSRFIYAAERIPEGQCDPFESDIYVYDLGTNSSSLVLNGAGKFTLIKE